jgi:hypothetical protein
LYESSIFAVMLLILGLFILFRYQPRTMNIDAPTFDIYQRLQREKDPDSSLICPCSNTLISYGTFASVDVLFHEVCSSAFVSDAWISALYMANASQYGVSDFRKAASSQVRL